MGHRKSPAVVKMTESDGLEIRLLTFQIGAAESALRSLVASRDAQMIAIGKRHGIDVSQGGWHFNADNLTITKQGDGADRG
jgi:hypothetical protein